MRTKSLYPPWHTSILATKWPTSTPLFLLHKELRVVFISRSLFLTLSPEIHTRGRLLSLSKPFYVTCEYISDGVIDATEFLGIFFFLVSDLLLSSLLLPYSLFGILWDCFRYMGVGASIFFNCRGKLGFWRFIGKGNPPRLWLFWDISD